MAKAFKLGTGGLIIGAGVLVLGYMYWKKIGPFGMMMPMKPMMMPPRPPIPYPGPRGMMGWPGMGGAPGMPGMMGMMGVPGAASSAPPMISANPISLNIGGQMSTPYTSTTSPPIDLGGSSLYGSPQLASPQTCPDGVNVPGPYGCPPPTNPWATSVAGQYGGYPMCE